MKTHFIGIGGIGMSALARLLLQRNELVSGSDQADSYLLQELKQMGAQVMIGHDPKNLPPSGRIVISSGIKQDNPELYACRGANYTVIHRADLLAALMLGQKSLLVSGTHGKTTTSSLLATVLMEAALDPSWAVGGIVARYQTNAYYGQGAYFVAEADESDGTHLKYTPYGLIVTNLNEDHLDFYGTKQALLESFQAFFAKVLSPAHLFWCGDCPDLQRLKPPGVSYGLGEHNLLRMTSFRQEGTRSWFNLEFEGREYREIELPLMGIHNALNATAVFGLALRLSLPEEVIRKGLKVATGAKRRLELKSAQCERTIFDDYAHHPNEIKATLAALRTAYPENRLVVLFQPHRYSRAKHCFHEFGAAFKEADLLFVTDIYGAGETPLEGITAQALATTLPKGVYVPQNALLATVSPLIRPFDVVVTLGAGDITKMSDALALLAPRKLKVAAIFGGRSGEHEVARLSAKNLSTYFNDQLIDVEFFAIGKEGHWRCGEEAKKYLSAPVTFSGDKFPAEVLNRLKQCDVAFPILHGPYGEDGTIQGLFEMLSLPYVGCSTESSSVAMNKALTKKVCAWAGVPVVPFVDFTLYDWTTGREELLAAIRKQLHYPLFSKPVHLGSTLGVVKVNSEEELIQAVDYALSLDNHVLVEQGVVGREIELSILGKGPWFVSKPGEICSQGIVYDYERKYGVNATPTHVEAELSPEERERAQSVAQRAYRAIGCDAMARVDLFLTEEGEFILNEINTIPGCTQNSLFPKMCANSGLPIADLLSRLIQQGIARQLKTIR